MSEKNPNIELMYRLEKTLWRGNSCNLLVEVT